jgi:hypothetical protein
MTDPTPPPEGDTDAGSRLQNAAKAIGCVVLAALVLMIALVIGVFDVFF